MDAASAGELWIVHSPELAEVALEWASCREQAGWQVTVWPLPAEGNTGERRLELATLLRQAWSLRARPADNRFCVLLLGDAGPQGLPTFSFEQLDPALDDGSRDGGYVSDHPYQTAMPGEWPCFALGRVPARTNEEARALLHKMKRYEAAPPSDGRDRIVYVAGEGRFGLFDPLLELLFRRMVDEIVPDTFDLTMLFAHPESIYCPPPSRLTRTLLSQLEAGSLLFNYVGHGSARGLDALRWRGRRTPILRVADLDDLRGSSPLRPVALLCCCSTGSFDLPGGQPSLAEALLFHPDGPIGVIAGSRITHPYASALLQKDVSRLLLRERVATLGELDLRASQELLRVDSVDQGLDLVAGVLARALRWHSSLAELRVMHVRLYNLLGDPTLRLALPPEPGVTLRLLGDLLVGTVPGMERGTATVRVETERESAAACDRWIPVDGREDPELERKAAHNYALANQRCLLHVEAEVRDGRFRVRLQGPGSRARVIKVTASGTGPDGDPLERVGSVRVKGLPDVP